MKPNTQSNAESSRILVVRVGALGDTLMVTPLLRALRSRNPQAIVEFLCSAPAAPLLELNPHLTRVYPLRGRNLPLALSLEKRRLVRRLLHRNYHEVLLLESAPRYRAIIDRARPRSVRSFAEIPFDPELHAIVNNLRVGGFPDAEGVGLDMELPLSEEDEAFAELMLKGLPSPRIGVHIGWGPRGRKRHQDQRLRGWPLENFAELLRRLTARNPAGIVLTGSKEDAGLTERLCRELPAGPVYSIAGKTRVRELAAVIAKLDLLISVDSGPCHMAAATGTPLVVLWGPGRLQQTRPLSSSTPIRIVRHPVPCAPCQSTPLQKTCRRNLCMELIPADEVLAAASSLLPQLVP